jgi:hypothetical protein
MLIEVVALQPPHHYQGVVTIQFKKLLTGEAGQVNSLNSIFRSGFTQDKRCYRAKCGKSFHHDVPSLALRTPDGTGQDGRGKTPLIQSPRRRRRAASAAAR